MAGREKALRFSEGVTVGTPSFTFLEASNMPEYSSDANFVAGKGSAAQTGDYYFNTTDNVMRGYNGSAWQNVGSSGGAGGGATYDGVFAAETILGSSEDPKAVALSQKKCLKIPSSSGWLDINEGTGEVSVQVVTTDSVFLAYDIGFENSTEDNYNFAQIVEDALNASVSLSLTYVVAYSKSTRKFTISAGANFSILWNTGTHTGSNLGVALGYNASADDSGASFYVSDYELENANNTFLK